MTEVMPMSAGGGVNLSTYTYTSEPRIVQHSRKSASGGKDDMSHLLNGLATGKYSISKIGGVISARILSPGGSGNPMYDRRIIRGSNYAKRIDDEDHPKWNPYFSNARSLSQDCPMTACSDYKNDYYGLDHSLQMRRQEFRQKLEARARMRRENHGVAALYSSQNSGIHHFPRSFARNHAHVQTENHYEPLERPPESEAGVQTDSWTEEGGFIVPVVSSNTQGIDASTQVFEAEIDADTDDDLLLASLVGHTMREAVMEVMREEQAEDARINSLLAETLSSFLKPELAGGDQDAEDENEEEEQTAAEEREEPEGKETTPDEEEAPPISPEASSPEPKELVEFEEGEQNELIVA